MDGRPTWTDCDEAGDYVVPNVLSPRDLVFRPANMDETVPHNLMISEPLQYSSIYVTLATMTSHYLYATLQTHLTNVNGKGQILFSMHHYRHIWTRPFLYKAS